MKSSKRKTSVRCTRKVQEGHSLRRQGSRNGIPGKVNRLKKGREVTMGTGGSA